MTKTMPARWTRDVPARDQTFTLEVSGYAIQTILTALDLAAHNGTHDRFWRCAQMIEDVTGAPREPGLHARTLIDVLDSIADLIAEDDREHRAQARAFVDLARAWVAYYPAPTIGN